MLLIHFLIEAMLLSKCRSLFSLSHKGISCRWIIKTLTRYRVYSSTSMTSKLEYNLTLSLFSFSEKVPTLERNSSKDLHLSSVHL